MILYTYNYESGDGMNKIYEKQSYLKSLETIITRCDKCHEGYIINLKDSILFPNEGGQYADNGTITLENGHSVIILDGKVNGNEVDYYVDEEIIPGSECTINLDWDTRYMRMQQHSGEHILSGLLHSVFGSENVGFHLSDDDFVKLDTSMKLDSQQINDLEIMANEVIYSNYPITDTYPATDELQSISYRSKIEINGQVRLITIGDETNIIDICACCAPHVKATGEIGIIKIVNYINYKGGTRLYILCGKRALLYLCEEHNIIQGIAKSFSTGIDMVVPKIESLNSELLSAYSQLNEIKENDLKSQINNMSDDDISCIFLDVCHSNMMKVAYNAMTERFPDKYVGVFLGNDNDGYRYNIGNSRLDSLKLKDKLSKLNAKGGGNKEMLQGKALTDANTIAKFFMEL